MTKTATADRKVAQEIQIRFSKEQPVAVISQAAVEFIWSLADDARRDDLTCERRVEIISQAVSQTNAKGRNENRLKEIAMYAVFVYDLHPKELTFFVPQLMPWPSYKAYCLFQAKQRKLR